MPPDPGTASGYTITSQVQFLPLGRSCISVSWSFLACSQSAHVLGKCIIFTLLEMDPPKALWAEKLLFGGIEMMWVRRTVCRSHLRVTVGGWHRPKRRCTETWGWEYTPLYGFFFFFLSPIHLHVVSHLFDILCLTVYCRGPHTSSGI